MILVTGSTGTFGSSVLQKLQEKNITARAAAQKGDHAFDWNNPASFDQVLDQVEKIYLVSPPNYGAFDTALLPFLEKAKQHGIEFILLSTVYGAGANPESTFAKAEKAVAGSGIQYAVVRPNFIFQNFINYDLQAIQSGSIYLPTSQSKTSYIDVQDVAAASVEILEHPEKHAGTTYTLTGSEYLSHEQIAAIFSEVLGKKVTNLAPTNEAYQATLLGYNLPVELVNFMGYLYAAIEAGYFSEVTEDYFRITGKKPTTIRAFIEQHRSLFLS